MTLSLAVWLVIVLAVVGANLPFVSQRLMVIGPLRPSKGLGWRLCEMGVFYLFVGIVAVGLEQYLGQIYPQQWEFYATTLALFVTLAFPGFVFRFLMRR